MQAHILRKDNGTGGILGSTLESALDKLNENYADANMQFYFCNDHNEIKNNDFYTWWKGSEWFFVSEHNVDSVLNIYFANSVFTSDTSSLCGYAKFPWSQDDYVVMKNTCAANPSTLSHELGHYFGLYHTHQTGGTGHELVDGSNCSTAGDELCDTPADPKLNSSVVNSFCEYTGTETDDNGALYKPDPTNIMSYSTKTCRDYFSPLQYERIQYYQENSRSYLTCSPAVSNQNLDFLKGFNIAPNPGNAYTQLNWTKMQNVKLQILQCARKNSRRNRYPK